MPSKTHSSYPPNLHICGPSNGGPPLFERMEQKYFVAPRNMGFALALLLRTCRWDDSYPAEQINSLYFDTRDLDQHERSVEGEFAKDKVRIRWYGKDHDPHVPQSNRPSSPNRAQGSTASVWVELKSRRGFASTKQRMAMEVEGSALALATLVRGIVPYTTLTLTLANFGFFSVERLHPVTAISYWRYRFVEPRSGFRVSLDSRIRSSMIMPGIGKGERGLELPGALIEVKGPSYDLPARLREVAQVGSSWTRYSKYSSCLQAHMSDMGSAARLWPSGTMYVEPCTTVPKSG